MDPAVAAAFNVMVPEDDPFKTRSLELKDCTPDQVFVPLRSGIVAPLVLIAVVAAEVKATPPVLVTETAPALDKVASPENPITFGGRSEKMSFVPALKETAAPAFELSSTLVREKVLPVFQVPMPLSHSVGTARLTIVYQIVSAFAIAELKVR